MLQGPCPLPGLELPDKAGVLSLLSLLAAGSLPQDLATVEGTTDAGVRDNRAKGSPAVLVGGGTILTFLGKCQLFISDRMDLNVV